ncbi:hypothetical protein [Sanguibacter sp. 25GB23B1]|uniref:sacsin N-terminal ATP-binding-like domain-containing protein n=1 Tax=unclassified Sanguibacter TaxID=2645534 RepID=UPI0032AFAAC0
MKVSIDVCEGGSVANGLTTRVFVLEEASEVARMVADHSSEAPRTAALIPADLMAADASVLELVKCMNSLPGSIRSALKRAGDSAALLSDDRLQGLAELIQNADDLGATEVTIALDEVGSRLLFTHNGAPLTLHDVWALAIPWLSLKVSDEEQLGRFGIGLKTLHALSDILEVHQGHFRVRFSSDTIQPIEKLSGWPNCESAMTTFSVPFRSGSIRSDDAVRWLRQWDDSGLVFLRSVASVRLINGAGDEIVRLGVTFGPLETLELDGDHTTRRMVTATDGRQWVVYNRSVAAPADEERAGKANGSRTPLGLALALFEGDIGHIHVGLPVRPVGLPFRMLAQFDPQPSRRDIADTDWNMALIPSLARFWRDAALNLFDLAPTRGWSAVPTSAEFDADGRTTGRLRSNLDAYLLRRARVEFAEALRLEDGGVCYALADLAYEAVELTSALAPEDVRLVSTRPGVLSNDVRSSGERWREVIDDLGQVGAATPGFVSVEDASILLDDDKRSPEFVVDLLSVVLGAGLESTLGSRACLILDDDERVLPSSRTGLAVLLPSGFDPIWESLNIGSLLHPAFGEHAQWNVIRDWLQRGKWLRSAATGADALAVLSRAGRNRGTLEFPLSDSQLEVLRVSLEAIAEPERSELGLGIGQAIRVDAVVYEPSGARSKVHARPCDAYFIERETNTWFVAAGKTPGLVWIDRRYSEKVRSASGRDGVGAQRLFRLLGAEVAPRLRDHPNSYRPLQTQAPGVSESAAGSPARRREALRSLQATFTVNDLAAPDLDAVLTSIAEERDDARRRRRAAAVLGTLTRAWERLSESARVRAATPYYTWQEKGEVDAWWISSAASIAWLQSENGTAAAPQELRIKSSATIALYGDDTARYLNPALDSEAHREVLARLGVAGDPTVSELVQKLENVRAQTTGTPQGAEDLAAQLYQALALQVRGGRIGGQSAVSIRRAFSRGDGLIATQNGWRRPSVVLAGPPIFQEMRDFVPSVSGTNPLWSLLGISRPTAYDARDILTELAHKRVLTFDEKYVMLEALRLLVELPESDRGILKRASVWVGDRWQRRRPIYATDNSLIADGVVDRVPLWRPGGSLVQFAPLLNAYKLTRLSASHGQVVDAEAAVCDANLTKLFSTAVDILRSDLARSDPDTEQGLRISWDELSALSVKVDPDLRVRLVEPTHGLDETIELGSWLDVSARAFYVSDKRAIGAPNSGAYAIASVFEGDARRIAHDWAAAWSMALEGERADSITTAASLDAERKRVRDERSEESLRRLAAQGRTRRSKSDKVNPESSKIRKPDTVPSTEIAPKPMRRLIDLDALTLKIEDGEIVGGPLSLDDGKLATFVPRTPADKPREPDVSNPRKPGGNGYVAKNYTDQERETIGLELVRRVLGGNEAGIVDIRHQHNVGADAVDDLENFFELKVYAGPIPEVVSLTNSEFRRAQETEQFFLVVVGNVEQGEKGPEILIFTDPLNHLIVVPQGSMNLGGIRDAKALRYRFEPQRAET